MTTVYLHAGLSKCGSSAIQTAFTDNPVLTTSQGNFVRYAAINNDRSLVYGSEMTENAATNPYDYYSSVTAKDISEFNSSDVKSLSNQLSTLCGCNDKLVLSNEAWFMQFDFFREHQLLHALDLDAHVIVYVRPPVEWLNSAWWQWGAWLDVPLYRWVENRIKIVCWHNAARIWSNLDHVQSLTIRPLPADVVNDFCQILGLPAIKTSRSNTGLPATVLRLFQNNRQLRPGPHDSAIDFVLSRHLHMLTEPTPWVLGPKSVKKIIEGTRESNLKLLEFMDADSAAQVKDDPRWWDPSAYSHKKKKGHLPGPIPSEKLRKLIQSARETITELRHQNGLLEQELHEFSPRHKLIYSKPVMPFSALRDVEMLESHAVEALQEIWSLDEHHRNLMKKLINIKKQEK